MTEIVVRSKNHAAAQGKRKENLQQPTERSNTDKGDSDTARKPTELGNQGVLRVWVSLFMNACKYPE